MIYQLEILEISIVYFSTLESEFQVKEWTWWVGVMKPASLFECSFEVRISSCYDEYFLIFLQSIFLLPFAIVSTVWEWSKFSFLLFDLKFFLFFFWAWIVLVSLALFLISFLFFDFGLFFLFLLIFVHNLIIIDSFKHILLYCVDNELL